MTSVLTDKEKADLRDGTRDIMELIDDVQSAVIKRLAAGVSVEPANSDLADEISAIDCMYRGDPSYEHDAYYMREQAAKRVRNGYLLVTLEQLTTAIAAARVQENERCAKVCDRQAIPNAGFLAEKVRALINTNLTTGEMK